MSHDVPITHLDELLRSADDLLWVDLFNTNRDELNYVGKMFDFHPLALEDCLQRSPRAKVDYYGDYYFFVFHALRYDETQEVEVATTELNVFLGSNYVVTIHQEPLAPVGRVADRCRRSYQDMNRGPEYLLYTLVDGIVDEYFPITDRIAVRIDELEDEIYTEATSEVTEEFLALKRTILLIRRVILPQRRIFSSINGNYSFEVSEENRPYYGDLADNLDRIIDQTATFRDLVNGALDTYYTIVSARTNEVMRVLTIISTFMLPLTFITGVFGMNIPIPFHDSLWGWGMVLGLFTATILFLLLFFRRRHWL